MDTRTFRLCLCLLVAALATGCEPLRGFLTPPPSRTVVDPGNANAAANNAPNFAPNNPGAYQPETIPGGTIIATGGIGGQAPAPGTGSLPAPRPLPVPPGWPPGVPVPPSGTQPTPTPGTPGTQFPPGTLPGNPVPPPGVDPHLRISPTVTGGRLNLGPGEVPTDRVVELSKQLEVLLAQNRDLLARIKELETLGVGREQALAEAMREIDTLTAASDKERAALQAQVLALQGRIKQLEEEDIIFLRAVLDALGKLLPPEKKP